MKTTAIFLVCLVALGSAELMSAKMQTLLEMKASAGDAMDTVLQVLNDLRQSAVDEQTELDAFHDQKEEFFQNQINDLTTVMNTNRAVYDSAINHREYIEDEIEDTTNYLAWIANRYLEIEDLIEALQTERCEASLIFVTRIREHYEALDAIALLRQDLADWEAAGMPTLAQIKELPSFNKLSAYTHLFKKQALQAFLSLTEDADGDGIDDTARRTAEEIGDDHVDNDREELVIEGFQSGADERDVAGSVVDRLNARLDVFVEHLQASMKDLQQNEVRAGHDMVAYIQEAEKEVWVLETEEERRHIYLEKLKNDLVLAQAYEEKCEAAWEDSVAALQQCKAEREAHREWYMAECDRIRSDIEVVDEVVQLFLNELAGIDQLVRDSVVEYMDDDRFDQGIFQTRTDQNMENYSGRGGVTAVVAAQAREELAALE